MRAKKKVRTAEALGILADCGYQGCTSSEYADKFGLDRGITSTAFSQLKRYGLAVMLAERRNGRSVYVLTEYLDRRPLARPKCGPVTIDSGAIRLAARAWSVFPEKIRTPEKLIDMIEKIHRTEPVVRDLSRRPLHVDTWRR